MNTFGSDDVDLLGIGVGLPDDGGDLLTCWCKRDSSPPCRLRARLWRCGPSTGRWNFKTVAAASNFLFIGPRRKRRRLLRRCAAHDNVFIPAAKDIYFFDRYYAKGLDWYLGFFAEVPESASAAR